MFCKVIFCSKNRLAKSAKSFFVRKTVLQSLQSHFSFEKPSCKVCKVIFRLKMRLAKLEREGKEGGAVRRGGSAALLEIFTSQGKSP